MAYTNIGTFDFHNKISATAISPSFVVSGTSEHMQIEFVTTGTFIAKFLVSMDNIIWHSVGVMNCTTYEIVSTASDAEPIYEIDLDKWKYIRVQVTSITGTLTVKGYYGRVDGYNT